MRCSNLAFEKPSMHDEAPIFSHRSPVRDSGISLGACRRVDFLSEEGGVLKKGSKEGEG